MEKDKISLEFLVKDVLKSRKYKNISPDFIRNTGEKEILKRKKLKDAVKATKNKLHQTGGSYFKDKIDYARWLEDLKKEIIKNDRDLLKTLCRKIMSHHISTGERITILEHFYRDIFSYLPEVNSIIDLGSGLNPLSIFWIPEYEKITYYFFDIYKDMISFLNDFMGLINIKGRGEVLDLTGNVPEQKGDAAFLFKLLPVLEQSDNSVSLNLLRNLNVKNMVVTFPAKSLCGKNKNMPENYEKKFLDLIKEEKWLFKKLEFETELVFIVYK